MGKGKVYIVGAGPGRPDLISVRGLNILEQAEVVIYDYLVDRRVLKTASAGAELICSDTLGKKRYADTFGVSQNKINQLLVKAALKGRKVVRLKNGDPSIFGRLSEELEVLRKHKIEFEIVPGITAASAAAAYTGTPLTDRRFSSSLAIVTGHEDPGKSKSFIDWKAIASRGTVVLYMAVENLPAIADKLILAGKPKKTPALIVSRAGDISQKIARGELGNIAALARRAGIKPPAVVMIGEAAGLAKKYNWFEKNRRILFTGLSDERFFLRGNYFYLPLIEILPIKDYRAFDRHLKNIKVFDWIVFSSRYGVKYFFERLAAAGFDARALAGVGIAATGKSTEGYLARLGVKADLVPEIESARGLLAAFRKTGLRGKRVFMPRSDLADKGLETGLAELGATVSSSIAYRNVMPGVLPAIDLNVFDEICFTAPSTVRNFKKRYGRAPKGVKIRWLGQVTKREVARSRI